EALTKRKRYERQARWTRRHVNVPTIVLPAIHRLQGDFRKMQGVHKMLQMGNETDHSALQGPDFPLLVGEPELIFGRAESRCAARNWALASLQQIAVRKSPSS